MSTDTFSVVVLLQTRQITVKQEVRGAAMYRVRVSLFSTFQYWMHAWFTNTSTFCDIPRYPDHASGYILRNSNFLMRLYRSQSVHRRDFLSFLNPYTYFIYSLLRMYRCFAINTYKTCRRFVFSVGHSLIFHAHYPRSHILSYGKQTKWVEIPFLVPTTLLVRYTSWFVCMPYRIITFFQFSRCLLKKMQQILRDFIPDIQQFNTCFNYGT